MSMAEIAGRAGVGLATALRRFPRKRDLVIEVAQQYVAAMRQVAHAALCGEDEPWEAFAGPIRTCCMHQAQQPGLSSAFAQLLGTLSDSSLNESVGTLSEELSARAKVDGSLRKDITIADVLLAGVIANSPEWRQRHRCGL